MTQNDLLQVEPPFIVQGSFAMVRVLELPPGDPGIAPHRHSGPVFGYMLEGEMLFELEGQAPYPVKAGEAFWEPGGEVIHYTIANLLADRTSRLVVVMLCAPGVEMLTFVDDEELAAKESARVPAQRAWPLSYGQPAPVQGQMLGRTGADASVRTRSRATDEKTSLALAFQRAADLGMGKGAPRSARRIGIPHGPGIPSTPAIARAVTSAFKDR